MLATAKVFVEPLHLKVIHPPDLWHSVDGNIDTKTLDVLEVLEEHEVGQRAVLTRWTSWSGGELSVWLIIVTSRGVVSNTSELPLTIWTQGVATN